MKVTPADHSFSLGSTHVTALVDAVVDLPFDLGDFHPGVPAEAWEPWRRRHPQTFWRPDRHRVAYTAYAIRRHGLTVLVDAGMGPAESAMSQAFAALDPQEGGVRASHRLPEALAAIGVGSRWRRSHSAHA